MDDFIRTEMEKVLGDGRSEPKSKRIVEGLVTSHKKSLTRTLFDILFAEDLGTIAKSVSKNIMEPYIKDFIVDSFTYAIEKAVYGSQYRSTPNARRSNRGTSANDRASYSKYYDSPRSEGRRAAESEGQEDINGEMFEPVVMKTRQKAEELLLILKEDFLYEYSCVTINDLNDTLGRVGTFNTTYYGWRSLDDIPIRRVYDGYLVDFPKPVKI